MVGTLAAGGGAAWPTSSCAAAHRRGPLPAAPMPRTPPQPAPAVTHHGSRAQRAGRAGRHAPGAPIAVRNVTANGSERRALSGLAPPASRAPEDRFKPLRRNDLHDPPLSAGDLCQPSGPDGKGQARGQARDARDEPLSSTYRKDGAKWMPTCRSNLSYRCSMTWSTAVPAIITAATALLGVGYGARLSTGRETLSWIRDQRLKAYTELLQAIEKSSEAFDLIIGGLRSTNYNENARQDPKIANAITEWLKRDDEINRYLSQAALVCSQEIESYLTHIRLAPRKVQRLIIVELSSDGEIDERKWERAWEAIHSQIAQSRLYFRDDITHTDRAPTPFWPIARRWKAMRRVGRKGLGSRRSEQREDGPLS